MPSPGLSVCPFSVYLAVFVRGNVIVCYERLQILIRKAIKKAPVARFFQRFGCAACGRISQWFLV